MTTVPPRTDNVTPDHERIMALGLAMARQSFTAYPTLARPGRRALLKAWAGFVEDLAACGVRLDLDALKTSEE